MTPDATDLLIASHQPVLQRIRAQKAREHEAVRRRLAHETRLEMIRKDNEAKLNAARQAAAARRRRDEAAVVSDIELAMSIYRGALRGKGKMPSRVAMQWHRIHVDG